MTETEKLAELKKWARSFRNRCTKDINHWRKYNEKTLEIKAFGMLQSIELVLNKIKEFDNEKPIDSANINQGEKENKRSRRITAWAEIIVKVERVNK